MKWASLLIPIGLAVAGGLWFPFHVWIDMNQGLIAFLGLIGAALIQVIPVTANFVQGDELTPEEAGRLNRALARQQKYWIGLLGATGIAFLTIVVASAIPPSTKFEAGLLGVIDVNSLASGWITLTVSFVILRMGGLITGVLSLQNLRAALVLAAAKRRAAAQIEAHMEAATLPERVVPRDYGALWRPDA